MSDTVAIIFGAIAAVSGSIGIVTAIVSVATDPTKRTISLAIIRVICPVVLLVLGTVFGFFMSGSFAARFTGIVFFSLANGYFVASYALAGFPPSRLDTALLVICCTTSVSMIGNVLVLIAFDRTLAVETEIRNMRQAASVAAAMN